MAPSSNRDSSLLFALAPMPDILCPEYLDPDGTTAAESLSTPIPVFDLLSDGPLPPLAEKTERSPRSPARFSTVHDAAWRTSAAPPNDPNDEQPHRGTFWFDGDVLMCGCPDCSAPMTVRLWLMIADCWRCGTSIELTEVQQREIEALLRRRELAKQRRAKSHAAGLANGPTPGAQGRHRDKSLPTPPHSPAPGSDPSAPDQLEPHAAPSGRRLPGSADQQDHRPRRAPAGTVRTKRRIRQIANTRLVTAMVKDFFKLTPAWLVSLVFHFLLLTILALLTLDEEEKEPRITLSVDVKPAHLIVREGGEFRALDPREEAAFDVPPPSNMDLKNPRVRETLIRANQDARELLLDPNAPNQNLPSLPLVKQRIKSDPTPRRSLAARDPRLRVEMIQREGGTTLTEAAVARGLRWLALHQNRDGSWGLHDFDREHDCACGPSDKRNKKDDESESQRDIVLRNDPAATSLALLPFLGAGQTHMTGRYKTTVAKGLRWLLEHQTSDGYLGGKSTDRWWAEMYAHGQAAIVLCEAFALEGDEKLRQPAQQAIDFIADSQYTDGGWRYSPKQSRDDRNSRGDTSVFGWQLMALQSARAADLRVSDITLELADQYLDSVQRNDVYSYQRKEKPSEAMTAEAILCRMYLGWTKDMPRLRSTINLLSKKYPPEIKEPNLYYWYYATQAMHHYGGPQWQRWNSQMRDILVSLQETKGHQAGSWTPRDWYDQRGGRVYCTSLATCTLEVYYRHLPLFKQIDLDVPVEVE